MPPELTVRAPDLCFEARNPREVGFLVRAKESLAVSQKAGGRWSEINL